jgi:hypothetical protein
MVIIFISVSTTFCIDILFVNSIYCDMFCILSKQEDPFKKKKKRYSEYIYSIRYNKYTTTYAQLINFKFQIYPAF